MGHLPKHGDCLRESCLRHLLRWNTLAVCEKTCAREIGKGKG